MKMTVDAAAEKSGLYIPGVRAHAHACMLDAPYSRQSWTECTEPAIGTLQNKMLNRRHMLAECNNRLLTWLQFWGLGL